MESNYSLLPSLLSNSIDVEKKKEKYIKMKVFSEKKIYESIEYIEDLCYNQCYSIGDSDQPGGPLVAHNILPKKPEVITKTNVDLIYNLTLSLFIKVYGNDNEHVKNFQSQLSDFNFNETSLQFKDILSICLAKLKFINTEIRLGLLTTIENEVTGEIVTDFLLLARKSLSDDMKAVASVLSCASLEDSLKRFAILNNLEVEDKTMIEVVNALKSKGLLSNIQSNILKGYTQVRNKAFHAEWDKIEKSDISAIIGFTEQFILQHFSGTSS